MPRAARSRTAVPFAGAALALIACLTALCFASAARPPGAGGLVALAGVAFAPYSVALLSLRSAGARRCLWPVLGVALLARLVLVPAPPVFSDDVFRYRWDGRVVLAGIDPYEHPPAAPALAHLRDDDWGSINHPELRTVYPPAAQGVFTLLAAASLGITGFKLAFALADTGIVLLLFLLAGGRLRRGAKAKESEDAETADQAVRVAAAYGLCPLPCIESAMSGHLEPLAILPLMAALLWIGGPGRRGLAAAAALGLAGAVKLVPLLLVPFFGVARRQAWAVTPLVAALLLAPAAFSGTRALESADAMLRRWEGNAGAFALAKAGAAAALEPWRDPVPDGLVHVPMLDGPARALHGTFFSLHKCGGFDPQRPGAFALEDLASAAAKLLAGAVLLAVMIVAWRRRFEPARAALWVLGALVLVTPVLHPWYLLWVLPLAALRGAWPWFVLAGTSLLSYLPLRGWWESGVWQAPRWIPLVEYGGFAAAAVTWLIITRSSRTNPSR